MAGNSISSQLQAIKTILNVSNDPEPGRRRPITRPSILFDAKTAADIDLDTILNIALSGLEVLVNMEERFRKYMNDLFSSQSKELDRELLGVEENKRINSSICSYLQLLSGFLEFHSALKTLEYLIRRYKIHVYNTEELILCALPYHDTHTFVQIVQIINTGNSRWKFLDGIKTSGAPPPRDVIVQQCIRDVGILEAICNYAASTKKIQPSKHMSGFCTAVIFEVLGSVTIDSEIVKRILPYVSSGLQPNTRGSNQKAGALMIVSLLAQKASLAPHVVKSLIRTIAELARSEAKATHDFQWLRMSLMALINMIQLQNVELIPKKTLDIFSEIRDVTEILSGLIKEFNINKFLAVFVKSLLEYSSSDDLCHGTLRAMIETLPMSDYVSLVVSKILTKHLKLSQGKNDTVSTEPGCQDKGILVSICEKYPNESHRAFCSFLKDANINQSNKVGLSHEVLCKVLDENLESSSEIPDPKILFALEHEEADIRRSAVLNLDIINFMQDKAAGSKKFIAIQDAILHRLYDEDINVILAVLNLKDFSEILSSPLLIEALQHVLQRCIDVLLSSSSTSSHLYGDAALLCLQQVIASFKDQEKYAPTLATIVFPLVLIQPKIQKLNMKALELAEELKWPFYKNLVKLPWQEKKLEFGSISAINMENICILSKTFSLSPDEYMPWLVKCCKSQKHGNTLFFLILLQAVTMIKEDGCLFPDFFYYCLPIIKDEWEKLESVGICAVQSKKSILERDCKGILEDIANTNIKDFNSEILACLFLRFLKAFIATERGDSSLDVKGKWVCMLQDLFLFFTVHSKDVFKDHLEYLASNCKIPLKEIIFKLLIEEEVPFSVQVESVGWFSYLCSKLDKGLGLQILAEFPCLLVPLSSENKDVRIASMICIEKLFTNCSKIIQSGKESRLHFLGELLPLIIRQKKLISSDKNVLASFFTSALSSPSHSLLVQPAIGKRFNATTKQEILDFIVGCALRVSTPAKLKILTLLKGLGSKLIYADGVMLLLNDLIERHHQRKDNLNHKLSKSEVDILCLLLESCARSTSSDEAHKIGDYISKVLQLNGAEDSTAVEPCLTVLRNLSCSLYGFMKIETQELIFRNLLILLKNANGDVHNATRETLLRINITCLVIGRVLDSILEKAYSVGTSHGKKIKKSVQQQNPLHNRESTFLFTSSFLDVLLMKKNIENRTSLVGPLFKLLHMIFTKDEWMHEVVEQDKASTFTSGAQTFSDTRAYILQILLITLEDICSSLINDIPLKDIVPNFDLQLLVSCARFSSDAVTRNHVFLLITTIAKIVPDKVLDQVLDILTAVGESTVTQWDSHSQKVFEGLISSVVPYWLSRTDNAEKLLQIFVNIMPQVAEHRRLSIIAHILRTLGETSSLGSLLFLLFRSLLSSMSFDVLNFNEISLQNLTIFISKQWEYVFSVQLCEQYSFTIWLPSVILALHKIRTNHLIEGTIVEMLVAIQFVADKLQDPEISYRLDSGEDLNNTQAMAGELMEQVFFYLQLMDDKKKHIGVPVVIKKELKEYIRAVLKSVTKGLLPSTYFDVIIRLMGHTDENVKKALGHLCETVKDLDTNAKLEKKGVITSIRNLWHHLDEMSRKSFENLCLKLLTFLDASDDASNTSLKLAAVSALEVLANRFPSPDTVFTMCLGSMCKRICLDNSAISCHCLRATGALINALGPKALPELPCVMECVLRKSRDVSSMTTETKGTIDDAYGSSNSAGSLSMSILLTLEAVINNLGRFLNPYLIDILRLVVQNSLLFSNSEPKLKLKAVVVRKLITDKIPVRLLLPPVLGMFSDAVNSGESSLSVYLEMLGYLVSTLDRSSINAYHAKIFDLCLLALDLRRQDHASVKNIHIIEQNAINVVVALTMKLTETMFRPLFIKTIEWTVSNAKDGESTPERTIYRVISFFGLVNNLVENHRSLFVPYFKYLLDVCVRYLFDSEDVKTGPTQKKAKLDVNTIDMDSAFSCQLWHLRSLILSALHKCFLYDTGSTKFLNSSNFQVLLKPIVMQLVMDPPLENQPSLPSVNEVDDLLVVCVCQMAVTAGSDLLWKPLNHEVLMQTRSEKVRARILGLRIVKHLVEKLKEEYLGFLPETIPFLGELLEDTELPVKSLAQEIFKEMEIMSGESLREYL